jgi:hypothetical protein
VTVQQIGITGTDFNIAIQSYLEHNYQLQRASSLGDPVWTNIGSPQAGNGEMLTFTDSGGVTGTQGFYRIQVSP